jgi:hypothetical protein
LITYLQTSVKKNNKISGGLKFYLIGSAISSLSPHDIDLVIVYKSQSVRVDDIIAYRNHLKSDGLVVFGLQFDICLLSDIEAKTNPFLKEENAILLFG